MGKYETRAFKGSIWLKIFFHNIKNKKGFTDFSEAMLCDLDNRYSILSEIKSNYKQKNSKFEFILEYPELDLYNRWQQTNFPTEEKEETGKTYVDGYRGIHIDISGSMWGGLANSTNGAEGKALLNGSPGVTGPGNWHFSVGQLDGAYYTSNEGKNKHYDMPHSRGVDIIYLWLKIPYNIINTCRIKKCMSTDKLLSITIFIICSY